MQTDNPDPLLYLINEIDSAINKNRTQTKYYYYLHYLDESLNKTIVTFTDLNKTEKVYSFSKPYHSLEQCQAEGNKEALKANLKDHQKVLKDPEINNVLFITFISVKSNGVNDKLA